MREGRLQMLELLPDATVAVGSDGVVCYANGLAARLLERPGGLDGLPVERAVPLSDETGRDWWQTVRPLERPPRLLPRIPEQQLRVTSAAGRLRAVTVTGARIDGDAEVALVLTLRRADRRRRVDEARRDLVSTVSHELRAPLTSVKGFTKTLLAKWDRFSDAQKQQMLATVNEDADRVTRLLTELLDVSRIDAGRLSLHRRMMDVEKIVERVVARTAVHDGRRPVRVVVDGEVPRLYADPDKVEQVLSNMVENALKYGQGTVSITIDAQTYPGEVCVSVSDEGPPIPSEHLPLLFTKFFRAPGERHPGTGLGLYISKGVVDAHGGRMWVESVPEKGTHFHMTLPQGGLELAGIDLPGIRSSAPRTLGGGT